MNGKLIGYRANVIMYDLIIFAIVSPSFSSFGEISVFDTSCSLLYKIKKVLEMRSFEF